MPATPETLESADFVIPFGADRILPGQLSWLETADGAVVDCVLPHATIRRAKAAALRLNGGGLEFGEPPPLAAMPEIADQLAYLLVHFQRYCGVLDKHPRRFLARYFDFVHRQILDRRAELSRSLARFQGLYRFDHWAFSAPRPLPRAHLHAPELGTTQGYDPADLVRVDFAFWTGAETVAIDLIGSETRGETDALRRARLTQNGVRLIDIPHDLLDPARRREFDHCLPADFHRFWQGEAVPSGPFTLTPLPEPP
jgi:hypothetical protein